MAFCSSANDDSFGRRRRAAWCATIALASRDPAGDVQLTLISAAGYSFQPGSGSAAKMSCYTVSTSCKVSFAASRDGLPWRIGQHRSRPEIHGATPFQM